MYGYPPPQLLDHLHRLATPYPTVFSFWNMLSTTIHYKRGDSILLWACRRKTENCHDGCQHQHSVSGDWRGPSFIHSKTGRWPTRPGECQFSHFNKRAWNEVGLFNVGSSLPLAWRNGIQSVWKIWYKSPKIQTFSLMSSLLTNPGFTITILKWNVYQKHDSIVTNPRQRRFISKSQQTKWCLSLSSLADGLSTFLPSKNMDKQGVLQGGSGKNPWLCLVETTRTSSIVDSSSRQCLATYGCSCTRVAWVPQHWSDKASTVQPGPHTMRYLVVFIVKMWTVCLELWNRCTGDPGNPNDLWMRSEGGVWNLHKK